MVTTGTSVSNGAKKVRGSNRTENHFPGSIVDGKTALHKHIETYDPIYLVAEDFLEPGQVLSQNRKRLNANRAENQGRQDEKARVQTCLREVYSTGLFGQPKFLGDFLIDHARIGSCVHLKGKLSKIAD
jgi:hypothetical protein